MLSSQQPFGHRRRWVVFCFLRTLLRTFYTGFVRRRACQRVEQKHTIHNIIKALLFFKVDWNQVSHKWKKTREYSPNWIPSKVPGTP